MGSKDAGVISDRAVRYTWPDVWSDFTAPHRIIAFKETIATVEEDTAHLASFIFTFKLFFIHTGSYLKY